MSDIEIEINDYNGDTYITRDRLLIDDKMSIRIKYGDRTYKLENTKSSKLIMTKDLENDNQ